jgi:CRP-like cAMP-binding protein
MCGELKYESAPRGTVIFNIGDIGRKWYYIIKGEVAILIPKDANNPTHAEPKKTMLGKIIDDNLPSMAGLHVVNELKDEASFGEIALQLNVNR